MAGEKKGDVSEEVKVKGERESEREKNKK